MRCIPIGRILSPHGIKGEVKFKYYNEVKEDFSSYTSLFVQHDNRYVELKLSGTRIHKGLFLLLFEGLTNPGDVRFLLNREIFVKEETLPEVDDGTYYDYQLIGLSVVNHLHEEVGRVAEIFHSHGTDFLVIHGREDIFLPMVDDRITEVNIPAGYIKTSPDADPA
jgi:16S rRNA processing protein RimM